MTPNEKRSGTSLFNWLGLGILALAAVGLVFLSQGGNEPAEPVVTAFTRSASHDASNPSPTTVSSLEPTVAASLLQSPIAVPDSQSPPAVQAFDSPLSPTSSAPIQRVTPSPGTDIQLTVLHSNDTRGYLLPCG